MSETPHIRVHDPDQLVELLEKSAISRDVLARARLETIYDAKVAAKMSGRPLKAWTDTPDLLPVLRIPYFAAGETDSAASALKPARPFPAKDADSKPAKYLRPKGFCRVYLSPGLVERPELIADPSVPKVIPEGEKKALAACSYGVEAIAISGVDNWGPKPANKRARKQLHPELALAARAKCELFLVPDADQALNWHVASSMGLKLADELARAGGHVFMVRLPESGPKGLDDYLAALPVADRKAALFALLEKAKAAGEHVPSDVTNGRVSINVGTDEDRVANEAVEALAAAGDRLNLYRRGTMLARVQLGERLPQGLAREPTAPAIAMLSRASLRETIAAACWFQRLDEEGEAKPIHTPDWLVSAVMDRGEWDSIRHIAQATEVPAIAAGGRIVQVPGHDAPTGIYYAPRATFPQVPERPSEGDVRVARGALEEVVCDFHFETPAHRSAWFSLVLTMLSRFAFDGPTPLFLIDANTPGTGKGLLVDVASLIATGRTAALSSFVADDIEMGKRILGWAMAGTPLVALDNVSSTLGGDELCKVLTSTRVEGRVLGSTQQWTGNLAATFVATANNAQLGTDMHRRVCHVRVLADDERPENRSNFRHADLRAWVRKEHPRLAVAALTLLRASMLAEGTRAPLAAWGSYEGWTAVVRAAVVFAGWPDPGATREELSATSVGERPALQAALVHRWASLCTKMSATALSTKRAIAVLCPSDGEKSIDPELREIVEALCGERLSPLRLGHVMREMRSRVYGGRALVATMDRKGVAEWSVVGTGGVLSAPAAGEDEEFAA